MTNILSFIAKATSEGGGSYDINSGSTNPSTGFMVSKRGCEKVFGYPPGTDDVLKFVSDNIVDLAVEGNYIGIWDGGDGGWYLDVSVNIRTIDRAIHVGLENEQIAIWDCANGRAVSLKTLKDVRGSMYTNFRKVIGGLNLLISATLSDDNKGSIHDICIESHEANNKTTSIYDMLDELWLIESVENALNWAEIIRMHKEDVQDSIDESKQNS